MPRMDIEQFFLGHSPEAIEAPDVAMKADIRVGEDVQPCFQPTTSEHAKLVQVGSRSLGSIMRFPLQKS
eukprot:2260105-Prymnesium_polylepis.1